MLATLAVLAMTYAHPEQLVETDWVAAHSADANVRIVDMRQNGYVEGHVPGAVLIPLDQLQARWEEVPAGAEIPVICRTGARSGRAVEALNRMGRRTVNVAGGTLAWIEALGQG